MGKNMPLIALVPVKQPRAVREYESHCVAVNKNMYKTKYKKLEHIY